MHNNVELTQKEQNSLQVEVLKLKAQNRMLARTTAKLLSEMSDNLAVSGVIGSDDFQKAGLQRQRAKIDTCCHKQADKRYYLA